MPNYPGTGQATLIKSNQQLLLFDAERVSNGMSSVAYLLDRLPMVPGIFGASFEIWFSGDPGSCQIDIQTADVDKDSHYCAIKSFTDTDLNTNFVGRIELSQFWARYVRANIVNLSNYVNTSIMVTR